MGEQKTNTSHRLRSWPISTFKFSGENQFRQCSFSAFFLQFDFLFHSYCSNVPMDLPSMSMLLTRRYTDMLHTVDGRQNIRSSQYSLCVAHTHAYNNHCGASNVNGIERQTTARRSAQEKEEKKKKTVLSSIWLWCRALMCAGCWKQFDGQNRITTIGSSDRVHQFPFFSQFIWLCRRHSLNTKSKRLPEHFENILRSHALSINSRKKKINNCTTHRTFNRFRYDLKYKFLVSCVLWILWIFHWKCHRWHCSTRWDVIINVLLFTRTGNNYDSTPTYTHIGVCGPPDYCVHTLAMQHNTQTQWPPDFAATVFHWKSTRRGRWSRRAKMKRCCCLCADKLNHDNEFTYI